MLKTVGWTTFAVVVVVTGFLYRYESLDPCEWMTQELVEYAGVPAVKGLGGTAGAIMGTGECLQNWMDLRVKGAEK
ncbi:MAG: hypothetical protein JKY12_01210 [Sneathiella sp.]|nr:hypothetical protein [Sneathiella sp.]